jgi:hypothetical protein
MKDDPVKLLADLDAVNRRIDNMRFLVTFQERKRDRLLSGIRGSIGRTVARTTDLDIDMPAASAGTRRPRTCMACGDALGPGDGTHEGRMVVTAARRVHLVHLDDVALLDMGVLTPAKGDRDKGWVVIDADCAARIGDGWTRRRSPKGDR